jgi:hypothetical protein
MGTILCSATVDKAEILLHDTANGQWTAANLFGWLKDGQKVMASLKPDVSTSSSAVVCVAGVKQTITGNSLIKITRNMGTDGATPGAAVTLIDMDTLNDINPDWPTDTASATVEHYMYDPRDPKIFYTYPAQPGSGFGYLEIVQATTPADPASIDAAITVDDIYEPALIDYIMYRALLKMAPHSLYGQQQALNYFNSFVTMLGQQDMREELDSPKV